MFRELLFMTLMHGTFGGTESTLEFKQDSDYIFFHNVYGNVEYISVDGVNISKAEAGSHCIAPNDCWELILNKRHLIALGWLNGPNAAFTMHPANSSDRLSVGFQYKKTSTPEYPPLKNGAISVFTKELHGNPSLVHFVLSNVDIGAEEEKEEEEEEEEKKKKQEEQEEEEEEERTR
nr:unnamed protein product [Spirometra erinaceieuropaei]